jgi:hypothetical protein
LSPTLSAREGQIRTGHRDSAPLRHLLFCVPNSTVPLRSNVQWLLWLGRARNGLRGNRGCSPLTAGIVKEHKRTSVPQLPNPSSFRVRRDTPGTRGGAPYTADCSFARRRTEVAAMLRHIVSSCFPKPANSSSIDWTASSSQVLGMFGFQS